MTTPRNTHTATLLNDGTVLLAGGDSGNQSGALASAELYNPAGQSFTATASPMSAVRVFHTATLLNDGTVLIAGGISPSGTLNTAELFNPATGAFTLTTGNMTSPRDTHAATLLNGGEVLITGGEITGAPSTFLTSSELYNPSTGTFSFAATMNQARTRHTATIINNGMVLVAGGFAGSPLASAELFDPSTNSFTLTGNMYSAHQLHTATLLASGDVLVAGGYSGGDLTTAELYTPATLTPANLSSITVTPAQPSIITGGTEAIRRHGYFLQ